MSSTRVPFRFASILAMLLGCHSALTAAEAPRLFPGNTPDRQWSVFSADGFQSPVSGVVYRLNSPPCCGVPLGGISTGCVDIDTVGTLGFCSIFNGYPRQPKLAQPFLGLAIGDRTWVLASEGVVRGGLLTSCVEKGGDPYYPDRRSNPGFWHAVRPPIRQVRAAKEIRYWGHYPVADIEYETDAPVQVGLRAWSPFVPGDVRVSDTPAAVFEVRLRNDSDRPQNGTIAMNFNGPLQDAKRRNYYDRQIHVEAPPVFSRREISDQFRGTVVSLDEFAYALGVIDNNPEARLGGSLEETTWSQIGKSLPAANDSQSGASVAVDFNLKPGEHKTIRFLLAWQVPSWGETGITWQRMNARVYPKVDDVIDFMVDNHATLLPRILRWQEVIYSEEKYPGWLKDCLVNSLALITEDGYYAQPTGPLDGWCSSDGLFGMIECPRACPQIECIPCSWYGNMPIVYFFPTLARTTLEGYRQYMREDGAAPFCFGAQTNMWAAENNHAHENQIMLNGVCFVDMVYRIWQRTGDDRLLRDFYDAVKKSTTHTATMGEAPHPVVGFPPGDKQTEWWEGWPWTGIATHAAGMHLSNMLQSESMAEAIGDRDFAEQCRAWYEQGAADLEQYNWRDGSYLLYSKPQTGEESDKVMANQLDAEWANRFLGLRDGVFPRDRVSQALATIRKTCLNPNIGAVSFASRTGEQELTTYGIFTPEILILGMTYIYAGDRQTGMQVCHQCMENVVIKQGKQWDMPNQVRADTGEVQFGTDYYQMMILWAIPAAIEDKGIGEFCASGGLVDRVLRAGEKP